MTSNRWQEIERLYHLALQQDPEKREAFLEKGCEGDESLQREVKSLLASRSEAKDFIESPALEITAKAIAKGRVEQHPDLTDRNGPQEIWLRKGDSDRPVVTARNFPAGETTQMFWRPTLSPNADRVIYLRVRGASGRLWISAASGGSPINLTDETEGGEFFGSWSPDGGWYVYFALRNGRTDLMKVKTIGQATPVTLKANVTFGYATPIWSPSGDWIAYGQELISPDGKTTRPLGSKGGGRYAFSADGKLLYGMRSEGEHNMLFSVDIATGAEKVLGDLGKNYSPATASNLSLAPDGKSFVYDVRKSKLNL